MDIIYIDDRQCVVTKGSKRSSEQFGPAEGFPVPLIL